MRSTAPGRRSAGAAVLVLVVVVGAYVVAQLVADPFGGLAPNPSSASAPPRGSSGSGVPARPDNAQPMTVRAVHDGDTVWLQAEQPGTYVDTSTRVRVRLIGLDTPEVYPTMECYGQEATDHLRSLIPDSSTVYVTTDRESKDRYDRWLLYLWTPSGELVNYSVVAGGWGAPLRVYPNVAYWPLLKAAGAQAQADQRGLWGAC